MKTVFEDTCNSINDNICPFSIKRNVVHDPSLEPSPRDGSSEGSQLFIQKYRKLSLNYLLPFFIIWSSALYYM